MHKDYSMEEESISFQELSVGMGTFELTCL